MALDVVQEINNWIGQHKELVTFIVAPLTTIWITNLVNRSVEGRAAKERKLERELARNLKIADFRQAWIDAIRDDFTQIISIGADRSKTEADTKEVNRRISSVLLRMNPSEIVPKEIYNKLVEFINMPSSSSDRDLQEKSLELTNLMSSFLKGEWERIKYDLNEKETQEIIR